jgi:hypothetical protein
MDDRPDPHKAPSGFPEPPGKDPGDISQDSEPHHTLNNPVGEPDPTEWPDPYDKREDTEERDPHPSQDPEAPDWEGPKRDKLDQ